MHKTKSFKKKIIKKNKSQSVSTFSFDSKILFFYISYIYFLQFGKQNIISFVRLSTFDAIKGTLYIQSSTFYHCLSYP